MNLIQRVTEIVEEKIRETGLFIVDVQLTANRLLIHLDGDQGVSIDQCAAVSRHVGHTLEEEDLIGHAYTLEVSSPGVGAPLKLKRQFRKNTGRFLKVKMLDGSRRTGRLLRVEEDSFFLEEEKKTAGKKAILVESELSFPEIAEAKVTISKE